jgi:hypothetical protein
LAIGGEVDDWLMRERMDGREMDDLLWRGDQDKEGIKAIPDQTYGISK